MRPEEYMNAGLILDLWNEGGDGIRECMRSIKGINVQYIPADWGKLVIDPGQPRRTRRQWLIWQWPMLVSRMPRRSRCRLWSRR
jgi:hypothetical protein